MKKFQHTAIRLKSLTILTGASRGMGLAMAEQLLADRQQLVCVSRKTNDALEEIARQHNTSLEQWSFDLADATPACERLRDWLGSCDSNAYESVTLINNAAIISDLTPLRDAKARVIATALRVNLEAVMQLTATFLDVTRSWRAPRKVLNITSGNGRRAVAAMSIYSAAKAGMDHFTRCVALEEAALDNGAKLCSLAPGIIDTDMQTHARNSEPTSFPAHAMFVE